MNEENETDNNSSNSGSCDNGSEVDNGFLSEDYEKYIEKTKKILERLTDFFNMFGRFERTYNNIQNIINWFFAISTATFLWYLSGFDKFIINEKVPIKFLYIIPALLLFISMLTFAIIRIILFARAYLLDDTIENMERFPYKIWINRNNMKEKEIIELWNSIVNKGLNNMMMFSNLIETLYYIIELGIKIYVLGLLVAGSYILLFIIIYK